VRQSRRRISLAVSTLVVALCAAALSLPGSPVGVRASSTTASVWLQTMDSCEQALDGASYQVVGDNGLNLQVSTPGSGKQAVVSGNCPVQHGDCSSTTTGCVHITGLPPGSYRIHETATPPPNSSNPEGYAACNGGSACRRQETDITVSSSGSASGTTTNVYPDGTVAVYGPWPGSTSNPIVVHNFGLASPGSQGAECDGDGDADDHSTGSPSTHCQYPEDQESSACKPFPWSCTLGLWTPPSSTTTTTTSTSTGSTTSTSTTTTTSSTTDTTTTTDSTTTDLTSTGTTTSTTTTEGCGITSSATGKLKKGTKKTFSLTTAAAGTLGADLTWTPGGTVRIQLLDHTSKVLAQTTVTGGSLHLDGGMLAAGKYRIGLKLSGTSSAVYTLAVAHC
jgi:Prealbumin-like fold domain